MRVTLIAAMAANRVIGDDNGGLPWHLPAGPRRLQAAHHGPSAAHGAQDLGLDRRRPLPGRTTVVVTRDPALTADGAHVARSLDEGFRLATDGGAAELFVCGGEAIYRQTMGRADRLCLTLLDRAFRGDTHFPEVDPATWRLVAEERHPPAGYPPTAFSFVECERALPKDGEGGAQP